MARFLDSLIKTSKRISTIIKSHTSIIKDDSKLNSIDSEIDSFLSKKEEEEEELLSREIRFHQDKRVSKKQKIAQAFMQKALDYELKQHAENLYPNDYELQVKVYAWKLKQKTLEQNLKDRGSLIKNSESQYNYESSCGEEKIIETDDLSYEKDTIISVEKLDVNLEIPVETDEEILDFESVIVWRNRLITSTDVLKYARDRQKKYYDYYKEKILSGTVINLNGNQNYASILLLELKSFIDEDFNFYIDKCVLIARSCPEVVRNILPDLRAKLIEYECYDCISCLIEIEGLYLDLEKDDDVFRKGDVLKNILSLSDKEVYRLNKMYDFENKFLEIEVCKNATAIVYLEILSKLDIRIEAEGESLEDKFRAVIISALENDDYKFDLIRLEEGIYTLFYKMAENSIREYLLVSKRTQLGYYSNYIYPFLASVIDIEYVKSILLNYNWEKLNWGVDLDDSLDKRNRGRWKRKLKYLKEAIKNKSAVDSELDYFRKLLLSDRSKEYRHQVSLELAKVFTGYNKWYTLYYYTMNSFKN